MKTKIKDLKKSMYELKVDLSPEEGKEYFDLAYDDVNKNVEVPGFRRGKTPRNVLNNNYKGLIKEKVINFAIPECYNKTIPDSDIEPIADPILKDVKFSSDSSFSFIIHIPVKPNIKLNKYKGIKLKKESSKVKSEEIEEMLKNLQEKHSEFRLSEENFVKEGNYITCDVKCTVNDEIIEDKQNIQLPIKEKFPIPELIKELKGAKSGEEKIIKAKLPENIYDDKYVGKKGEFHVKIHEIKKKILPQLNDEFAEKVGKLKSLDELRGKLKDNIKTYKKRQQKEKLQQDLIAQLIKYNKFVVPDSLVEKEKENLIKQTEKKLVSQGLKGQQLEMYKENMLKGIKDKAEKRVKTYFLLNHIASEENISVSDEEIKNAIKKMAESTKQSPQQLGKYLKKQKLLDNFIAEKKVEKIIDFLLDNAKIKTK